MRRMETSSGVVCCTNPTYALSIRSPSPLRRSGSATQTEWMHRVVPSGSWELMLSWVSSRDLARVPLTNPATPSPLTATMKSPPAACRSPGGRLALQLFDTWERGGGVHTVRLAGADPSGGCGLVLRVPRRLKRGDHVQVLGLRGAEERLVVCHHLIRHDGCGCGTNSPPLCRPFNRLRLLQALKVARPVLALAAHAGEMETGM
mmetsp:Transcript_24334/g.76762  ORF Transcript_24334/g.76762 Transcript_24334/m.76762 type:complete len:204 (+) Transcript_24334:1903-2514(+)